MREIRNSFGNFLLFYSASDPFSNWWSKVPFVHNGFVFANSEQAMMVAKAQFFYDFVALDKARKTTDPRDVKAIGRTVKNYDDQAWSDVRYAKVVDILVSKFTASAEMVELLLSTEDFVLVEASPHDRIWGIGRSEVDPLAGNPRHWQGQNLLGKALMDARTYIQTLVI